MRRHGGVNLSSDTCAFCSVNCQQYGPFVRRLFHQTLARSGYNFFFFESPWFVTYDFENKDVFISYIPSPLAE